MKGCFKTVISTVLAYLLVLSMLPTQIFTASAASYTGTGTENDPYIVSTGAELISVLEKGTVGVHIKLDNNITLGSDYVPGVFNGVFDGDFYKITAVTQFFTRNNGTLKNFFYTDTVDRINVAPSYAGIVCDDNSGIISGVIAKGNIDCACTHGSSGLSGEDYAAYVGLIAGYGGTIINCAGFGSVRSHCPYGADVGGLVSFGRVINSYAVVDVTATGSSRYGSSVENPVSLSTISNSFFNTDIYPSDLSNGYTTSAMKTKSFVDLLNSGSSDNVVDSEWIQDTSNKNSGYPILKRALGTTITSSKENYIIKGSEVVTLECTDSDATIYYTTNGTTPTTSSTVYKNGITVTDDVQIKAVAYKNGYYSQYEKAEP